MIHLFLAKKKRAVPLSDTGKRGSPSTTFGVKSDAKRGSPSTTFGVKSDAKRGSPSTTFGVKSGAGFTLIEGIIASGIISTALIVGLALAYSNLIAAQANSDRIIAGNLAREALEVVRNIRDSNWLRFQANADKDNNAVNGIQFYSWDDFFDGWPNYNAATCTNGDCGNYFDVILSDVNFSNPNAYNYSLRKVTSVNRDALTCLQDTGQPSCRVHMQGTTYFQAAAPSGAATSYVRRVVLKPICWDGTNEIVDFDAVNPDMVCPVGTIKAGVLATAEVYWQRTNKTLDVQLKERFYNWRTKF